MNTQNLPLVISDTLIHQDTGGHYCLNDLHKASGGEEKHKLANWLRLDQTKALINEIDQGAEVSLAIQVIHGGDNRGTYCVKELVYAYAMWISPKFHLAVIRAYDALVAGNHYDAAYLEELKSHLSTQKQLIESQQDQIAYIKLKCDEAIALKEQAFDKELRRIGGEKMDLSSQCRHLENQVYFKDHEISVLKRSKLPVGRLEADEICRAYYHQELTTKSIAEAHLRSPETIRRIVRERAYAYREIAAPSAEQGG